MTFLPLATVVGPSNGTSAPPPPPPPLAKGENNAPANTPPTATATPGGTSTDGKGSSGGWGGAIMNFLPIILIFVVLYFLLFRNQKKDRDNQKKMLETLKKGDKVMTIGGLIGSVVDVRGDEVVLKVDEANNVKERYIKSAIQKVLESDTKVEDKK